MEMICNESNNTNMLNKTFKNVAKCLLFVLNCLYCCTESIEYFWNKGNAETKGNGNFFFSSNSTKIKELKINLDNISNRLN